MYRRLLVVVFLLVAPAPALAQDEDLAPDGDSANDASTSCDTNMYLTIDDDPDAPLGDWCTADNNNTSWATMVTFPTPTAALSNATDAQAIEFYVRAFDETQSGEPTIQVDIYDGIGCADIHESGSPVTLTDAGFPAKVTELWTAAGISGAADICVNIACTKAGGAPTARNSCDIDAIEWDVTWSVGPSRSRAHVIGGSR